MIHWSPNAARWMAALAVAAALGGCNDDDAPAATAQAAPDTVVATWNSATTIDALANDSVTGGTASLTSVVRAPANGSAAITDGRVVYTPRSGFFGTDTLRYAMRAGEGGAVAEAEVSITVEAELALSGVAVDAPLAGAAIAVSGAASAAATADAQGRWQASVRMSDPEAVLRIEALGTGTQQHVRLASLAAASDIVAAADDKAAVDAKRSGALAVSHFTTAAAALAERAADGAPATATALRSAAAGMASDDVLSLATLIHLVAEEGLALPAGVADTLALARDAAATATMLAAQTADSTAAAAFLQAQMRAVTAAPAAGELPGDGVLVAYADRSVNGRSVMVTLSADAKASVSEFRGTRSGRWAREGDAVIVTLDTPFSTTSVSEDVDPVTLRQIELRNDDLALRLRMLPGGVVELATQETVTYLSGPKTGQTDTVKNLADAGAALRLALDPAGGGALAEADFATGKRWAGVIVTPFGDSAFMLWRDTLEVTAPGAGRAERQGIDYTFELAGASLKLAGSDGSEREYLRLGDGPAGSTAFLAIDRSGSELRAHGVFLIPTSDDFKFDTTNAARIWQWDQPGLSPQDSIALQPGGASVYYGTARTWALTDGGRVRIIRPSSATSQLRIEWLPLRRGDDGSLWVLRLFVGEDPAQPIADNAPEARWEVLRYRDLGPATN